MAGLLSWATAPAYAASCTAATLSGSYGLSANTGSFVIEGLFTFDGVKKLTGTQTNVSSGNSPQTYAVTGTYSVRANCTIVINHKYFQGGALTGSDTFEGEIVSGGTKVNAIQTGPGTVGPLLTVYEAVQ